MSLKSKLSLSVVVATALVLVPAMALAQDGAASNKYDAHSWLAVAAGFAIGIAALGGTMGQGRAAAAALEGISRNPGAAARIQTPMILGLALIESLVLFAWVIAFFLQGKIAL
ncbi:ATP synthase subunit c [Sorangium cellulosum]|jgi:F-type H+-transporting ATPase subunit c|uniref:ATP synthase subunit c n=1 Tax=Sorangium cellulosum TaxID=56 RepID=A0A4P2QAE4_SORCE|nr:ATP synthase F0 subunit C [Sorangium cellulosum]AUX26610.1 ATP synthase subunit c [Sorangium cellulosum]